MRVREGGPGGKKGREDREGKNQTTEETIKIEEHTPQIDHNNNKKMANGNSVFSITASAGGFLFVI